MKKRRTAILVKNATRSVDQLSHKRSSTWRDLLRGSRSTDCVAFFFAILALILFKLYARLIAGKERKFEELNYMMIKTIISKK